MSDRIGATDSAPAAAATRRHLQRVQQGQQLTGVCAGIAAYAEVRVDWVRTFVVLATLVTAGLFGLVYVALTVILTVDHSMDAQVTSADR